MDIKSEKPRPVIHITTAGLGPHGNKVAFAPRESHKRNYTVWIWTLATVIIGVSVGYFTYDTGRFVANYVSNKFFPSQSQIVLSEDVPLGGGDLSDLNNDTNHKAPVAPYRPGVLGTYYFFSEKNILPRTISLSFLVADIDTGEVIVEKKPDLVLPIASVSKLMNAVVATDILDPHEIVTVTKSSIDTYGTVGGLATGEKILVKDLYYPLLMESSNDAAEVLASAYDREAFIFKMNEKAKELGMTDTSFEDASGLSANNVSTSRDLFILADYIDKNHPDLWDITRIREFAILKHDWVNNNPFMTRSSFIGGKNGYTYEADRTTVSIFELDIDGQKRKVAIIVLKSSDIKSDVDSIIRFLQNYVGFLPEGTDINEI